mmetsp:Transcript_27881/g.71779  ORF Transcript_27881/g.71779 Transcript_27881/m.71779 type:complete len:209 (+) Transcript_27881:908-1534(+)
MSACRLPATHISAVPLGPHSHLWQLPVKNCSPAAASSSRSTGSSPTACAPSITTSTPRRVHSRRSSLTGSVSAELLVIQSNTATVQPAGIAAITAANSSAVSLTGRRTAPTTSCAPTARHAASAIFFVEPYPMSGMYTTSEGVRTRLLSSTLSPAVALGSSTRSCGRQLMSSASFRMARTWCGNSCRSRKRSGWRSQWRRHLAAASNA